MSKQIFNGGIRFGILKACGRENLSLEDQEYYDYLDSLPKNQWIDLDVNGKMITRKQAQKEEVEYLSKFKHIK